MFVQGKMWSVSQVHRAKQIKKEQSSFSLSGNPHAKGMRAGEENLSVMENFIDDFTVFPCSYSDLTVIALTPFFMGKIEFPMRKSCLLIGPGG